MTTDLIAAEWIKLRSLPSTYALLVTAAVTAFCVGLLVCHADASHWASLPPAQRSLTPVDPSSDAFVGFSLAQLVVGAVGVLAFTSEYSSGLIRTTFAAVPARREVLLAKAAVVAAVTLAAGLVMSLATFSAGQAVMSPYHLGISLGHPGALRAVLAAAAYLVTAALIGLGLGVLIRSAVGALTATVVVLFLVPSFLHGTSRWLIDVANALPPNAIRRLVSLYPWPQAPSITESVIVVVVYPLLTLAAAAWVLHRRDA